MVCYNHENGIFEPRLFLSHFKKFHDRIIGVFYATFSRFRICRNVYFSFWISKRSVVRNRHPMMEERFTRFIIFVHFADGFFGHIFVTNSPNISKSDFFWCEIISVYNFVAISSVEIFHIVKIAVASV